MDEARIKSSILHAGGIIKITWVGLAGGRKLPGQKFSSPRDLRHIGILGKDVDSRVGSGNSERQGTPLGQDFSLSRVQHTCQAK